MRPLLATISLALLFGCGPQDAQVTGDEAEQADQVGQELKTGSIVHWQVNSDWAEWNGSTYFTPPNIFRRAAQYAVPPDLFSIQECGRPCACGTAANYDPATAACIKEPTPESLPGTANRLMGLSYGYAVSVWANSVLWRADRFTRLDVLQWNAVEADPTFSSCGQPRDPAGNDSMNIAVLLRDNRGTPADPSDDVQVVLASMHVGNIPGCTTRHLKYFNATVKAKWGTPAYVFLSGDWNMTVDTHSATTAGRRAELAPDCWYQLATGNLDAPGSCGRDFADYFDAVAVKHPGGAPYSATRPICSQYTFLNPADTHRPDDVRCDSSRSLSRIDYTFVKGTHVTAANILKAGADQGYYDANGNSDVDPGEQYAGHRSVRTVVGP